MKPYAKIAVCHPGKIGDAIYTLPAIQEIAKTHGPVDFYTSSHCAPLRRLFERQPCIQNFFIPPAYVIKSMDCGVQPWEVPVDHAASYEKVYQMGFQGCPAGPLPDYIAAKAGLTLPPITKLSIECPSEFTIYDLRFTIPERYTTEKYIILAARTPTSYDTLFQEFIRMCPLPVIQAGAGGQFLTADSLNLCGIDFLEMATLIKRSAGFVGLMSAPLVVANAFDVPKVAPHDGVHWDMSHVLRSPLNHYPVNPAAKQILELLGI